MVDVKSDEFSRMVVHAVSDHSTSYERTSWRFFSSIEITSAAVHAATEISNISSGDGADRLSPFTSIACETPLGVVPIKYSSPAQWTVAL
jgi:hypothetical protein